MDHRIGDDRPERVGDPSDFPRGFGRVGLTWPPTDGRWPPFVHGCADAPSPWPPRLLLRIPPGRGNDGSATDVESDSRTAESAADAVICRRCRHAITAAAERRTIQGAHLHTFANPEGIVFEIACYRDAWGCAYVGPASSEFTWFAGYRWRIAVCAGCHTHLGWRFAGIDGHHFHGLITGRIVVNTT